MKKIIALTLVLILAVGLFAGCKSSDKGSVYFLNFKPEADSAWQALAKTYTPYFSLFHFNGGLYGLRVPSRDCHGPVGASQ